MFTFSLAIGVVLGTRCTDAAASQEASAKSIRLRGEQGSRRLGDHYLMLVNTAIASMIDKQKLAQFEKSNYDGLAVTFSPAYDVDPVPTAATIEAMIADWKSVTKKDIWPWVFLNRMIGPDLTQDDPRLQNKYFRRTRGADLDGKTGARADFLLHWEHALRAARDARAPGIVCDLEFYNSYKEYDPRELARATGETTEYVEAQLRRLGSEMADIAAAQYPGATLWFLFTALTHAGYTSVNGERYHLSPAYIALGVLDEIQKRHFPLYVVSGGEVGLGGYCHPSLGQFRDQIEDRGARFKPQLGQYEGILGLGGTMTLWSNRAAKRDWVAADDCAACPAETVDDLQPYLELLLKSYKYNWIYASADGGYYAFEPGSAGRFDAMISRARAHTSVEKLQ